MSPKWLENSTKEAAPRGALGGCTVRTFPSSLSSFLLFFFIDEYAYVLTLSSFKLVFHGLRASHLGCSERPQDPPKEKDFTSPFERECLMQPSSL